MKKDIKLVVTDIDGTIVKFNGELQPEIIAVFEKLKQKGVKVVIATGRMYNATSDIVGTLNLNTPVICYQGAMIRDDNNIYFEKSVAKDTALNIIDDIRSYGAHINLYLRDRLIVEQDDKYIKEYAAPRSLKYEVVKDLKEVAQDATKILAIDDDSQKVTIIRNETRKKYPFLNIVKSTDWYCEFVNQEADKGLAIKYLADMWGISLDEVLAIGDQDNDIEMIKVAGIGIAMGNGSPNIKKVADYVCPTVENFGFARAMEQFVL